MTTEQKAKAYDKAIKRARKELQVCGSTDCDATRQIFRFFPELAESEDERIREALVNALNKNLGNGIEKYGTTLDAALAWLEKQGKQEIKQKPIWKHWKDGIAGNGEGKPIYLVKVDNTYRLTSCLGFECDYIELSELDSLMFDNQGEQKHKFNIGDVISNGQAVYRVGDITKNCIGKDCYFLVNVEYEKNGILHLSLTDSEEKHSNVGVITLLCEQADKSFEKQGEQKNFTSIEPKFKVGDWITNGIDVYKIKNIDLNEINYNFENGSSSDITLTDNISHLWTIKDAKDGDVLHSTGFHNDCIFIFNGLDNWRFDKPNGDRAVATGYCCLFVSADKMEFGMQGPDCVEVNTVKPATKIQRDLLFQKMKESGYEWDAEKKELKEIEQNLAETNKSEEWWKELSLSLQIQAYLNTASDELYAKGKPLYSEKSIDDIHKCMKMWAKLHHSYFHDCEQTPAWSEEDEMIALSIEQVMNCASLLNIVPEKIDKIKTWLKFLKNRVGCEVNCTTTKEWSEEDEKILNSLISSLSRIGASTRTDSTSVNYTFSREIDWLKSLKDRYTWKPSDEQMAALSDINLTGEISYAGQGQELINLYNDLKNLKG